MGPAVDQGDDLGPASGVLRDAFQITERGCVGIFADLEGIIRPGDTALLPDGARKVTGIEMLRFSDPAKHPRGSVGILLDGAKKDAVLAFKGMRIRFEAGDA